MIKEISAMVANTTSKQSDSIGFMPKMKLQLAALQNFFGKT